MTAPEAKAELIRTLDEKFVANSIAFDRYGEPSLA